MLQIRDLEKSFQSSNVLDIPTLSIEKGEIVGFVGNNGAGKTTLFRLFLDLIKPSKGNVLINGADVSSNDIWKDITGSYLDSGFLIEYFTSEEFFTFVASAYKIRPETMKLRLEGYESFMKSEVLGQKKYIRSFSAGNKQKIGIIAAMLIEPELLILDEPFNFLDPSSQIMIKQLLKDLNTKCGTTIIISSHNLEHIIDLSTRIILLEKGLIVKDINNANGEAESELRTYFSLETGKKVS
jgi:ABC-2 type transport system ATP-binding protein